MDSVHDILGQENRLKLSHISDSPLDPAITSFRKCLFGKVSQITCWILADSSYGCLEHSASFVWRWDSSFAALFHRQFSIELSSSDTSCCPWFASLSAACRGTRRQALMPEALRVWARLGMQYMSYEMNIEQCHHLTWR